MTDNKTSLIGKIFTMSKSFFIIIVLIMLILVVIIILFRFINHRKSQISTANGIQENIFVELNGIDQFIQIRGENTLNPVILFLHGGPGFPLSYLSYYYQVDLESDYTFVCWDQRGCGRTYYKNLNEDVILTHEQLLSDTDELVNYILERFDQERLIIMGQSWGTILGTLYIKQHPEKISAYIGVGQITDFDKGKIVAAEEAVRITENKKMEDMQSIKIAANNFSKVSNIEDIDIPEMESMITKSVNYLRGSNELSPFKQIWIGLTSPSFKLDDIKWFMKASSSDTIFRMQKNLIQYMYFEFDVFEMDLNYEVPVYYISGGNDWITPFTMVSEYYEQVRAPDKSMIIIPETGHTPFLDQPKTFAEVVKSVLNGG